MIKSSNGREKEVVVCVPCGIIGLRIVSRIRKIVRGEKKGRRDRSREKKEGEGRERVKKAIRISHDA